MEPAQKWNFRYSRMPDPLGTRVRIILPLTLQMGSAESPSYFCPATKTGRDAIGLLLEDSSLRGQGRCPSPTTIRRSFGRAMYPSSGSGLCLADSRMPLGGSYSTSSQRHIFIVKQSDERCPPLQLLVSGRAAVRSGRLSLTPDTLH